MNILHVIPGLEIRGGGGNRACAELCESLAALGHEVSLCHVKDGSDKCFAPRGVRTLGFPARGPWRRYAYSPALRRCLHAEIPQADIVHIHALWQYPNIPASGIATRYDVPYVVQPHGSLHPWKLRHKPCRKWIYGQLVERRILRRAAFVHVESEADAQDVRGCLPGVKTVLSPCGAFREVFDAKGPDRFLACRWPSLAGKTCILYLARIDVNKGVDLLLQASRGSAQQRPDLMLLMVGPDYAGVTQRMQHLCRELGISQKVVWAGAVPEDQRIWIMQQSDLYVLPSLSENFGISVLEAMFCGKPIITTTATPWAELQRADAGLVVEPTADAILRALRALLRLTAEQRARMGANARSLALRKYEWKTIARDLVDHYAEAVAAGKRRNRAA